MLKIDAVVTSWKLLLLLGHFRNADLQEVDKFLLVRVGELEAGDLLLEMVPLLPKLDVLLLVYLHLLLHLVDLRLDGSPFRPTLLLLPARLELVNPPLQEKGGLSELLNGLCNLPSSLALLVFGFLRLEPPLQRLVLVLEVGVFGANPFRFLSEQAYLLVDSGEQLGLLGRTLLGWFSASGALVPSEREGVQGAACWVKAQCGVRVRMVRRVIRCGVVRAALGREHELGAEDRVRPLACHVALTSTYRLIFQVVD